MNFDLFQAKVNARTRMRESQSNSMLVTLAAAGVIALAMVLVAFGAGEPYAQLFELVSIGYGLDEALIYLLKTQGVAMVLYLILTRAVTFFAQMVAIGLVAYAMKVVRGQQSGVRDLLAGFAHPGQALALVVLSWLINTVCQLPFTLGTLLLQGMGTDGMLLLGSVLQLVGNIVTTIVQLHIGLAAFCFLDAPHLGAVQALKRSVQLVRGDGWNLWWLQISFFGWLVLGVFTLGILYLWLVPYYLCTVCGFYETMQGKAPVVPPPGPTAGDSGYAGPSYDNYRPSGPEPF